MMERKISVQKLLFVGQNDSAKQPAKASISLNKSMNSSAAAANEAEMNADESLRLNDSQSNQAKANLSINLSIKSFHEIDMSVDDSLVLNDIRNIFETSTSSAEFIIKPPKSECLMIA